MLPIGTLLLFGFVTIERGRIVGDSFTLEPLARALQDPLVWRLTWRSFWVAAVSSLLTLVLAYPVAYVFAEVRGLWRTLILVAVISPLLTSALVRAYAWLVILGGRQVYEQTIVVLDWTRGAVLATILLSTCFAFVLAIVALGNRLARWNEARR